MDRHPTRYAHVLRAVEGRPWALMPSTLALMADLVRLRASGERLAPDEVERRLAAAAEQNGDRAGAARAGSVAVLPVYGLLSKRTSLMSEMSGGTSYDSIAQQLAELCDDPTVSHVVLDVDSPGGEVDGLPELAATIRAARTRKPVVAQVDTLAASAAYWLASQASEVVCTPSGEVGSVGVYTAHQDVSGAEEKAGVRTTLVSAAPHKVEGNPYEPLGEEARAAIQAHVDAFYGMFLQDVALGRGTTPEAVAEGYGQGRTLLAQPALKAGMVDAVGTLAETVARLQRESRRPAAAPTPIKRPRQSAAPDAAWTARVAQLSARKGVR